MTAELGLCIAFMIVAFPTSKSVAAHYLVFGVVNFAMLGVTSADASFLAALFAVLFAADAILVLAGGRRILLLSAAASAFLCIESLLNMDWLLSRVTYLSIAVNTAIAASLAKELIRWMNGRRGR